MNRHHYRRENNSKPSKKRSKDLAQNPLSPKVYVPLLIFGILVVIYAFWNPFSAPALTLGGKEAKLADFNHLKVTVVADGSEPAKSGARKVKIAFSGAQAKEPISVKDNLMIISNHGVLNFKTNDKYVDLSTGKDTISGLVYGVKLPTDHIAVQVFSDQQKLLKQTPFQPVTFPLEIKNLYLQGAIQKSADQPKIEVGIYLKNNNRYEDNALWDQVDEKSKQNQNVLNVSNGGIETTIKNTSIRYKLTPDEVIQTTFYTTSTKKSQVVTELKRYVDGEPIPKKLRFTWEIEFKDQKYSLIYQDDTGKMQKAALKEAKTGNFETFAKAREIPDPAPPTTTVKQPDSAASTSSSSAASSSAPTTSTLQSTASTEVQHRVLALLIKHWPTPLNQSQTKLFTLTSNNTGGNYTGVITYTYTTNNQINRIDVMNYDLKNDGAITYKSISQYSPSDFTGNIFSDVTNDMLNNYFSE
ncbi:hypothetical protein [Xylocopilactobacillus apicola]|nr:hypothetical protein [Xylocopilactobacillus apicola]